MDEMQVFYYENKKVRTVQKGGYPWFVLKDVCQVLNLGTTAHVSKRLDGDEVNLIHLMDSLGRRQKTTVVSESGLYNIILRSDKPEAKPFRKWVTSQVLPSIRQNGGYIAGQENMTPDELMAKALMVAQKTIEDQKLRLSNLTIQNQIMQPKRTTLTT